MLLGEVIFDCTGADCGHGGSGVLTGLFTAVLGLGVRIRRSP